MNDSWKWKRANSWPTLTTEKAKKNNKTISNQLQIKKLAAGQWVLKPVSSLSYAAQGSESKLKEDENMHKHW